MPLIVGLNNPGDDWPCVQQPLDPIGAGWSAGARLFKMSQMALSEYLSSFERVNMLDQGLPERIVGRTIVVLGRETWKLCGLSSATYWFDEVQDRGATWILFPHPSGRNLLYNDERVVWRARHILQQISGGR